MALTGIAKDADLLVIGSHGQGERSGMHLGSVASYCAQHAPYRRLSPDRSFPVRLPRITIPELGSLLACSWPSRVDVSAAPVVADDGPLHVSG